MKAPNTIFSTNSPKAIKAQGYGYLNAIHYMAPHTLAGVGNLCPKASAGCMALCLGEHSGQAGMVTHDSDMNTTRLSRRAKAQRFMRERPAYMREVVNAIEAAKRKARRKRLRLCVRLNGSTDIAWEGVGVELAGKRYRNLMDAYPKLQFVDYTKIASRFKRVLPSNYHLTLSRNEVNERECIDALGAGVNVAVVFAGALPKRWNGYKVIDGDKHDLRHLDPRGKRGVVVGLSPKGRKAKRDTSGFVVQEATL